MELRADAARNRAAIVEAARAVFAEHGLDAPLDDIARLAGTGNATLYRRFPTRGDLVEAVFAERMAEHLEAVQSSLADPDPWEGFASYFRAAAAMQAAIAALRIWSRWTSPQHRRSGGCALRRSTVW